jgi:hypothetical protein
MLQGYSRRTAGTQGEYRGWSRIVGSLGKYSGVQEVLKENTYSLETVEATTSKLVTGT